MHPTRVYDQQSHQEVGPDRQRVIILTLLTWTLCYIEVSTETLISRATICLRINRCAISSRRSMCGPRLGYRSHTRIEHHRHIYHLPSKETEDSNTCRTDRVSQSFDSQDCLCVACRRAFLSSRQIICGPSLGTPEPAEPE